MATDSAGSRLRSYTSYSVCDSVRPCPRPPRAGEAAATVPMRSISPSWFGEANATTYHPNARLRRRRTGMLHRLLRWPAGQEGDALLPDSTLTAHQRVVEPEEIEPIPAHLFPPDAASLLPGLLAATRTGLTPAGNDELTTRDHLHTTTSCLLGTRKTQVRRQAGAA
jgi:hypothetical protein